LRSAVWTTALVALFACEKRQESPPIQEDAAVSDASADAGGQADQTPPVTVAVLTRAGIGSENSSGWPNVTRAEGALDWKSGPYARVLLAVDLETTCYPFESWAAHPPPAGQNWPADCDAFDRNFSMFIDDGPGAPGIAFEVIHAITPFGGPLHLEVDLTDLANGSPGTHRLQAEIVGYSDAAGLVTGSNAGWTVSARIELTPGRAPRSVLAAVPLFLGKLQEGDPWPIVSFETPAGSAAGRLEYRASGHGQGAQAPRCVGPAEEFCDRRHQIRVDGVQVEDISAYREDCASLCTLTHYGPVGAGFDYCLENPGGLPESVRAPCANWCPGSMTPPFSWADIPMLAIPGSHTFSFQISQIAAGGHWLVSAIYYAYGE
jgi:hypothetical protein